MDSDLLKKESPDGDRGRERERSRRGDRPSRFSSNTRDRSPVRDRRDRKPSDRRVYVSNVAYESKWQDIKDLFRTEVGEVTYVDLFTDENDKPRGCGIVEFDTPELAARAVEKMHRFDLKGRKLVVKEASSVKDSDMDREKFSRPSAGRSGRSESGSVAISRREEPQRSAWTGNNQVSGMTPNTSGGGSSTPNKFGNTYGLTTSFLESLWINGPLVSKVFVANLDYKVDEKKLREVFRLAGKVVHAEINMDKEGKSRGFGVVEYDHPVEAVQAISLLHNQALYDRRLTVRMDRVDKADGPPKLPEGLKSLGMGLGENGTILNDVARNLPSMSSNNSGNTSAPIVALTPNVQQLQLQAAAAQAQVQLAQGAQLGQPSLNAVNQGPLAAHLTGSNTLAPNLSNVAGLLGQSLNVSDIANLNAQSFGPSMSANSGMGTGIGSGLSNLNAGLPTGLGVGGNSGIGSNFNSINNQNSMMGGSNSFNNAGSGLHSPGAGFGQSRPDFDSMSAALSGSNPGGFGFNRDNFRGTNNMRENNYNGSSRGVNNGRGNIGNPPTSSNTSSGVSGGGIGVGSRRVNDTVIVKNLPPNTQWQHVLERFREVGDVADISMLSKDSGLVKFTSEWEAERAVRELDRSRYEGRTIDVRIY